MSNKIIIIDGNSLINRAYYAMQKPMITKDGLYTQGVYGFLNILNRIYLDYEPDYITVTFDKKAPTFRHLEYKEYKAGRKKMPPELAMQMPLLKEALQAMNIKIVEMDGFEADDLIGTIARDAEENGLAPLIITGDKDELQLVTKITKVLITKKGISDFDLYDEDAMLEKYGFTPKQFIDYKGLMGDQSDNIPGIPGVGEKTATKLILEYGSIGNLLENLENMTNKKLKQKIEDNAQLALMSLRLATINTNVPIEINFDEFKAEEPNYDELVKFYLKVEFNSFLKKLKVPNGKLENENADTSKNENREIETVIVSDDGKFKEFKNEFHKEKLASLKIFHDQNHKDIPKVYGISILLTNKSYFIQTEGTDLLSKTIELLTKSDIKLCGHNLKSDYYALMTNGFTGGFNTYFDTEIAQYLLEPSRSNYELKGILLENFNQDFPSESEFFKENGQMDFLTESNTKYSQYGTKWCLAVMDLIEVLNEKLKSEGLINVLNDIELPLIEVMASMENIGFPIDRKELTDAKEFISLQIEEISRKIYGLSGEEFNINSPIQLGDILFEKLGLPAGKKTKRGYSTSAEILEKLRDKHEIIDYILEYRTLTKLNSTYIEGLLPLIHKDGKIHAHFQQTVAATGRISCTEPNLQNIPIKQEMGRKLRKAFIPESNEYTLVSADYSQIELRVLAHMSQDTSLIEAFNNGDDIHRLTASKVFGIPQDEVTSLQRSNAKAVNFGVIYGMSGFGLSTELNITRKEAEKYIDEYFKKYFQVKQFMDGLVDSCKKDGFVSTIMNRKRNVPEINASNYMVRQLGERLAMNSPIQGSAADIIKIAMIKVYNELKREGAKSKLILQVHDELIIQTHKDEFEKVKKLLVENMENAVKLSVKLSVDLNTGDNWYELK
ncbi:DNA polymerase I [Anaerovorax odorimutans]|uniref:DNA polymerase I n=1 Tax=Anaerovorax odorimutans TaxID=109327 RepID=UPI0004006519|nr:DNA polymerase I [Anaerovorax odorimutans]